MRRFFVTSGAATHLEEGRYEDPLGGWSVGLSCLETGGIVPRFLLAFNGSWCGFLVFSENCNCSELGGWFRVLAMVLKLVSRVVHES